MVYVYKSPYRGQLRYWRHHRLMRRALEYAITAGAAVLASYSILRVRW